MTRQITEEVRALIRTDEGLRLTSYQDVAGVWTVGYGHVGIGVTSSMTITLDQAVALLNADLMRFEEDVDARTHDVPTTDNQFSAMVSLSYNIGSGAFAHSHVLTYHRQGLIGQAAAAFLLWDHSHVNGQLVVLPGLLRRRQQEAAIYGRPDGVSV